MYAHLVVSGLVDHYLVERELGRGMMATVYLARDRRHGRPVALKVLHPELRASVSADRFLQEIRVTAGLTHPHILPLHDSGEAGDLLYFVMPFVEGESLRERLARERPLPLDIAMRLLREVASALDYAHRHGVVHRDVKPANVLLEDDHAVVADFGIARAVSRAIELEADETGRPSTPATLPGMVVGTPAYMAPEQVLGEPQADSRADLYALGMMAYETLSGEHPFGVRSARAMITAQVAETPRPIRELRHDLPPPIGELVMRLVAKDPADRPRSAAEVVRVLERTGLAPAATPPPRATITPRPPLPRWRRGLGSGPGAWAGWTALALGAAAAGYASWHGFDLAGEGSGSEDGVSSARAPRGRPSVVVLPFLNADGDAVDEPLSEGLRDELAGALGRLSGLHVAGRASSLALEGKPLDVRVIADTLGVASVLQGSVRRSGDRVRVSVQLVDAARGATFWSGDYDEEMSDLSGMEEEIARAVARALDVRLAGDEEGRLAARSTGSTEAHELLLRGRYFARRGTVEGLGRSVQLFRRAIAVDPAYARAHASLADAYLRLALSGDRPPVETLPAAREAAVRALALDDSLAEAHAALAGVILALDWDWKGAERALDQAIELAPNDASARRRYGLCLMYQGRFDEAVAALERARALDPLDPGTSLDLGRAHLAAGRPGLAIPFLRAAIALEPGLALAHEQLGQALLALGHQPEAVAAFHRGAATSGALDSAYLAYALAVVGDRSEARAALDRLLASEPRRYLPPVGVALAWVGLGDHDAAFRWLERGYTERAVFMDGLPTTPAFRPLHADARWRGLMGRMKWEPPGG